ncbi:hypothetical protein O181_077695 [Austropuccinia psidii MF-1]|uniref:DUF4939 domain-containing protein n=1 Tax=Austropuccinia psidii MF-1 TaxID=1389203 RepID=A0A9Q3FIE1_9BASI|nr:hypothetical protein [Austropuccinia psidii MF-1]
MEQMTQFMGKLTKAVSPIDKFQAHECKTPSVIATDSFDGTQANELRGSIKFCQLILHNDPENFFSDRKKVLYLTSFLTGRAGKWMEPCISNISNGYYYYLLNNWK